MRARLGILASGQTVQLREIILRDKPADMLEASPKGTVPVLVLPDGSVVDESFDIMLWALAQNDPLALLRHGAKAQALILRCEAEFKPHLDRFKYHVRYTDVDPEYERGLAAMYLQELDQRLRQTRYLFGLDISLADLAIAPFVRQFANTGRDWFDAQDWPALASWLDNFAASPRFQDIMRKYPVWQAGDPVILFPNMADNAS
jgi:glutathione S-transferase